MPPTSEPSTASATPVHTARMCWVWPSWRSAAKRMLTVRLASRLSRKQRTTAQIIRVLFPHASRYRGSSDLRSYIRPNHSDISITLPGGSRVTAPVRCGWQAAYLLVRGASMEEGGQPPTHAQLLSPTSVRFVARCGEPAIGDEPDERVQRVGAKRQQRPQRLDEDEGKGDAQQVERQRHLRLGIPPQQRVEARIGVCGAQGQRQEPIGDARQAGNSAGDSRGAPARANLPAPELPRAKHILLSFEQLCQQPDRRNHELASRRT